MMNKRNILMAGTLLGGMLTAMAQSVAVFHLNNGASDNYGTDIVNGYKMYVWQYQPDTTRNTYAYGDAQVAPYDVLYPYKSGHQYCMMLGWYESIPASFDIKAGLLVGTKPGISLDNCEWQTEGLSNFAYNNTTERIYYFAMVGKPYPAIGSRFHWGIDFYIEKEDTLRAINTVLEHGKTYYYRTYTKGYYWRNGEQESTIFYGIEKAFRVPNLMEDSELMPEALYGTVYTYPTPEAWAAFNQHFSTAPDELVMGRLWARWIETDGGKQWLAGADKQRLQFDDGSLTLVSSIPDSFYQWITSREIIINSIDQIAELSYDVSAQGDTLYHCQPVMVAQVDSKWQLPGNSYMRFDPLVNTTAPKITFNMQESLIPDMTYKAIVTFAPETRTELSDNTNLFLPTKLRIYVLDASNKQSQIGESQYEIPATEKTVVEIGNISGMAGLRLNSRVSNSEINKTFNRIMRISEIRLVPVKGDAKE